MPSVDALPVLSGERMCSPTVEWRVAFSSVRRNDFNPTDRFHKVKQASTSRPKAAHPQSALLLSNSPHISPLVTHGAGKRDRQGGPQRIPAFVDRHLAREPNQEDPIQNSLSAVARISVLASRCLQVLRPLQALVWSRYVPHT